MKTISIKQPWANLIVEGAKDIENRTWRTKFKGRVLIHAGQVSVKFDGLADILTKEQFDSLNGNIDPFMGSHCGFIIGSVEIVDCVINHPSIWAEKTELPEQLSNKCTWNWVLANPIKFWEPIPAKGKLSFWDYPNILAEPEETDGKLFCYCQLPIKEENQVMSMGDGTCRCRYCGGIWYK